MTDHWKRRRVLVTGATGLLGGWLVRELLAHEASVVAIVRDEVPRTFLSSEGLTPRITICRGDVRDQALVTRVLVEYEVEVVFHLAAQTIVPIANASPLSSFETNIAGTWTLLESVRHMTGVRAVLFASSDKAYGPSDDLPYVESHRLEGKSPYDVSKSCADLIAQCYARTWGVNVAIVRCGNLFGGGDRNYNRLVPGVIRDVMSETAPVLRSDGSPVRDYIYVEDAAKAYVLLAEALLGDGSLAGSAFNFSLEIPVTVLEMVELILTTMGSDLRPDIRATASSELSAQYLDASAARTRLGWKPAISLEEGISRAAEWYRTHGL